MASCDHCGSPAQADAEYCSQCGAKLPVAAPQPAPGYPPAPQGWQPPPPPPGYPQYVPPTTGFPGQQGPPAYYVPRPAAQYDGLSVAALVVGIASILVYPLGVVLGVLAVVFARKSRENILRQPAYAGMGFTTAGLVTGIIGISISGIFWVAIIIAAIASHG